MAPSDTVDGK